MACDKYLELLALRLDGPLSVEEERALELHLNACPDCRAAGAQLAALQGTFPELEEVSAPEGFARGVMDRIQEETSPKVIPLFKRPQVRALAGLAACLVLAVGLYGASRPHNLDKTEKMDVTARSFNRNASVEDGEGPLVNATLVGPDSEEVPQIAAYAAPGAQGLGKAVPDSPVDTERTLVPPEADVALILDRLPDGAAELIPSGVTVSHDVESGADVYTWLTAEELAAIEALAFEQGLLPGTTEGAPAPGRCALIVQNR
ncbi:MAG: zf-HC2 domain-containing protein [Lawsonibacter sp.]|nr:zf-HC2 domain-containing protein [Lawsonibacter sp.]